MNKRTRDNEQMPPAGGKVLEMPAAVPRPRDVVAEILRSGAQALLVQAGCPSGRCQVRGPGAAGTPIQGILGGSRSAHVVSRRGISKNQAN